MLVWLSRVGINNYERSERSTRNAKSKLNTPALSRHEFNGRVREDAEKGGRMALEESPHAGFTIYLRSCAERATPRSYVACHGHIHVKHEWTTYLCISGS